MKLLDETRFIWPRGTSNIGRKLWEREAVYKTFKSDQGPLLPAEPIENCGKKSKYIP